jgi:hypothetical protein
MTCQDSDVPNNITNTYSAVSTDLIAWNTYISTNTPTWFDQGTSGRSPERFIGIKNPGNGAVSTYVTSNDGCQTWTSIGTGNVALSYISIINVTAESNTVNQYGMSDFPPFNDTYNIVTSAISPTSEFGIQSPLNVNANLYSVQGNIVITYPDYIRVGDNYLNTGSYKNLGYIPTDGSNSKSAMWVKDA